MIIKDRFPVAEHVRAVCALLKIDPAKVLRRTGFPPDYLAYEERGVTAAEFMALWAAFEAEAKRADLPMFLGRAYAQGPFSPPLFALSCSPNLRTGLERLSVFKPLIGPFRLDVTEEGGVLEVVKRCTDPEVAIPPRLGAMELVYILEAARLYTAEALRPLSVELPATLPDAEMLNGYFGVTVTTSDRIAIRLSIEDATKPFISDNPRFWEAFEPHLRRRLAERDTPQTVQERVRSALLELLPAGRSTLQDVADHLHLSKRSLQRRLGDEWCTFQFLLDKTRQALAEHYLSRTDIRVEEVAALLAYADANSFYRAYQSWSGMTPGDRRKGRLGGAREI